MGTKVFYRLVCLLLAWSAFAANGAKAHVQWAGDETVAIPYCTPHGTEVLELSIGTEAPEATNTCCGDCTAPAALAPAEFRLIKALSVAPDRRSPRPIPVQTYRTPLWPGAPPQGPPSDS